MIEGIGMDDHSIDNVHGVGALIKATTNHRGWITETEASQITGMSVAWFQRMRWAGGGIPYSKLGRAVRYNVADVLQWMESRKRRSTSDDGSGINERDPRTATSSTR
jgi:predicted DNA-binding transcriptional regulator AlpA